MKSKQYLKLLAIALTLSAGLFLLYENHNSEQKVSNYETSNSQIVVIDLSEKNTGSKWGLFAGIFMVASSLLLAGASLFPPKLSPPKQSQKLTEQEKKVAQFIQQKMMNKQIAQELHISPSTVKTHINNIYKKMDVHSRAEFLQILEKKEV